MKRTLILVALFLLAVPMQIERKTQAQEKATQKVKAAVEKPDSPNAIALSEADSRQLALIADTIARLEKDIDAARKQKETAETAMVKAQADLANAVAFIAQFDQIKAVQTGLLYRVAADYCKCETKDLMLAPDGKSIVRKSVTPKP
jgi:predicted  nucleic acid-binding Zn-ribbon protein